MAPQEQRRQLGSRLDVKMLINGLHVVIDGLFADAQPGGNLLATEAVQDEKHDCPLPWRKDLNCVLRHRFFRVRPQPGNAGHSQIDQVFVRSRKSRSLLPAAQDHHCEGVIGKVSAALHPVGDADALHTLNNPVVGRVFVGR